MEYQSNTKVIVGSERSFGIVFSIVFFALSLTSIFAGNQTAGLLLFGLGVSCVLIAFFRPYWLKMPNFLWFKFGIMLGGVVAPLVMALIFITVFFPIGLIMRLIGYDPLSRKLDSASNSYWIERKILMQSMKRQF
jgi:hypothetical protein